MPNNSKTGHWEVKFVPDLLQLKASKILHMEMAAAVAEEGMEADPPTVATYTPKHQRGKSIRDGRNDGFNKYKGPAVTYKGDKPMTPDRCYYFCIPHETIYFAVSKGNQCNCFDHAEFNEVQGRHCNIPCPGDNTLMC